MGWIWVPGMQGDWEQAGQENPPPDCHYHSWAVSSVWSSTGTSLTQGTALAALGEQGAKSPMEGGEPHGGI